MQATALGLAIGATVAYHLVTKLVPAGASPIASLLVAYVTVCLLCAAVLAATPVAGGFRGHFAHVNWTAPAMAATVLLLDLGFILLYRSGFPVSLGALVTQSAAALVLLLLGVLLFKDRLTLTNAAGIVLCLTGLWLVGRD
jgi:drug/metabolite transporter (DMT)-like permease